VMYRIYKNQLKVLTNRRPSKPIPAIEGLEIEYRTIGGISKPFIVNGAATWKQGMPIEACEEELQRIGEVAFLVECQHEVERDKEGLVHKKYDDSVHPVSYSQFAAVYGSRDAWKEWYKVPFSDWARTKTKFHANVAGYIAISSANTKHGGFTFCVPLSFEKDTDPTDVAVRLLDTLTPYIDSKSNTTWKELINDVWRRVNAHDYFDSVSERLEYVKSYSARIIPQHSRKVLNRFNVKTGANSHSEDTVRNLFNIGFGFSFVASNPGNNDALEDIDEVMRVDYELPHIFDHEQKGYTRWYVLCKDDTTQKPKTINGIAVYPPAPYPEALSPDELHDDDLFRYQMCNRRFAPPKLTELGERIDTLEKLNDDFGQALQMVYFKKLLGQIKLTMEEKIAAEVEHIMPQPEIDEVEAYGEKIAANFATNRMIKAAEIRKRLEKQKEIPRPAYLEIG